MRRDHFEPHKLLGRGKVDRSHDSMQVDLVEQFPSQQRLHLRSLSQGKRSTHDRGGYRAEVMLERPNQRCVARALLQRSPDAEDQSSSGHQHPVHLTEGSRALREKLQTLLTQQGVKGRIRKGHGKGTAFLPLQRDAWYWWE